MTNSDSNTVSVIDATTNTVTATVPVGSYPWGVAVNPAGTKIYVANYYSGTISVIDTTTNKVLATVSVGKEPVAFGQFIGTVPVPKPVLPVANFTSNVTSGNTPLTVAFTDRSTGSPTSWRWVFQDGENTTVKYSKNPIHKYSQAGNYTVKLTATNAFGSNTVTKINYITVK